MKTSIKETLIPIQKIYLPTDSFKIRGGILQPRERRIRLLTVISPKRFFQVPQS